MKKRAVLAVLLSFVALGMAAPTALAATSVGMTRASAPAATAAARALAARDLTAPITLPSRRETSSWVVYSGTSMTGTSRDINGCGTHNRPFPVNSYRWVARGQSGRMYNCFNAGCAVNFVLPSNSNASSNNPVGWKSIFIVC